jgi:acetyl-CoA C-acetyltransferase
MMDAYLLDGARSPIAKFGGALKPLRAVEFASVVVRSLLQRAAVQASLVERVYAGRVIQEMTESNPARVVGRCVGVPDTAAALTINMQCCSGMAAFIEATNAVRLGELDCALVIGLESLTNAGHVIRDLRWGTRLGGAQIVDLLQESSYAGSRIWGQPMTMAEVAEHHTQVDGITRQEMEEYTVLCHKRTVEAARAGRYDAEIIPIPVPARGGRTIDFVADEHPRADCSLEGLAGLPPLWPNGLVTAGTSAGLNDGAAAALVCSDRFIVEHGLKPLAKIADRGTAMVGCDPALMGYSAVNAVNAVLTRAERRLDAMDLIECNEGFAAQIVADAKIGGWSLEKLNVDGGSLALGHPVGMSGLRLVVHLGHALRIRGLRQGVAAVPAGSGLGTAVILDSAV